MRVVPHRARQHHFDFLSTTETRDLIVVRNLRVKADILKVLGDDLGLQDAEA